MADLQIFQVLQESRFTLTRTTCEFFNKIHRRIIGSLTCERAFNIQKNMPRYKNRQGTIQKAFHTLIESRILEKAYKFKEIKPAPVPVCKDAEVPVEAFTAKFQHMPKQVTQLMSYKQQTTWHTSTGQTYPTPYADLPMISQLIRDNMLHLAENRWLGQLLNGCHSIVLRRVAEDPEGKKAPWMLACGAIPDSTVVMWPLGESKELECGRKYFEPGCVQTAEEAYQAVVSLDHWEAIGIKVLSPLSQHRLFGFDGLAADLLRPKLRIFMDQGEPEPLTCALARQAFNETKLPLLLKLAEHLRFPIDGASLLYEVLDMLLSRILAPISAAERLEILSKRMVQMHTDLQQAVDEFLDFDDVMICLDRDDMSKVHEEVRKGTRTRETLKDFVKTYAERHRAEHPPPAPAPVKGKGRGRGRARGKGAGKGLADQPPGDDDPRQLPQGDLVHADLKMFCPRGGHIWRGNTTGAWHCHFAPFPRRSFTWATYGHRQAAVMALRSLWECSCVFHNRDIATVPIEGLFLGDGQGVLPPPGVNID